MTPYHETNRTRIFHGDALVVLRKMEAESVNCCITSPPYWGLRDYGIEGQLGLEENPEVYVAKLVEIFREVRRVLRGDGTLWLNIGDSYNSRPNQRGVDDVSGVKQGTNVGSRSTPSRSVAVLKPKELIGIPWMVAFALRADGWYLRQDIIWAKPNPMPESVTDRCTKAHEYIFLMSKSPRYHYNADAIKERCVRGDADSEFNTGKTGAHQQGRASGNKRHKCVAAYEASDTEEHRTKAGLLKISDTAYEMRNKRDVWQIASEPTPEAHFATFPTALVRPAILAGCPPGGIILDPFAGSGTTMLVARDLDCGSVGIELNAEYIEIAKRRLAQEVFEFSTV